MPRGVPLPGLGPAEVVAAPPPEYGVHADVGGLRDAALCEAAAIEGCKFCHASGFIGGNATYEGALAMALKTIELAK